MRRHHKQHGAPTHARPPPPPTRVPPPHTHTPPPRSPLLPLRPPQSLLRWCRWPAWRPAPPRWPLQPPPEDQQRLHAQGGRTRGAPAEARGVQADRHNQQHLASALTARTLHTPPADASSSMPRSSRLRLRSLSRSDLVATWSASLAVHVLWGRVQRSLSHLCARRARAASGSACSALPAARLYPLPRTCRIALILILTSIAAVHLHRDLHCRAAAAAWDAPRPGHSHPTATQRGGHLAPPLTTLALLRSESSAPPSSSMSLIVMPRPPGPGITSTSQACVSRNRAARGRARGAAGSPPRT